MQSRELRTVTRKWNLNAKLVVQFGDCFRFGWMIWNCKLLFSQFQKYEFDTFRFLVPLREKVNLEFGKFIFYPKLSHYRTTVWTKELVTSTDLHLSQRMQYPNQNQMNYPQSGKLCFSFVSTSPCVHGALVINPWRLYPRTLSHRLILGINLPSMSNLNPMSNQNNRLQQNQQAAPQAAAGGAPPFMHPMVMPGRDRSTL